MSGLVEAYLAVDRGADALAASQHTFDTSKTDPGDQARRLRARAVAAVYRQAGLRTSAARFSQVGFRGAAPGDPADEVHRRQQIDAAQAAGIAHAEKEEFELAVTEFEKAISLGPEEPKAHFNLALVRQRQERPGAALVALYAFLALDEGSDAAPGARDLADRMLLALGPAAADAFPSEVVEWTQRGVQMGQAGQVARAMPLLARALGRAPGYPNALLALAGVEAALGAEGAARHRYQAYLRVLPDAPGAAAIRRKLLDLAPGSAGGLPWAPPAR